MLHSTLRQITNNRCISCSIYFGLRRLKSFVTSKARNKCSQNKSNVLWPLHLRLDYHTWFPQTQLSLSLVSHILAGRYYPESTCEIPVNIMEKQAGKLKNESPYLQYVCWIGTSRQRHWNRVPSRSARPVPGDNQPRVP